MPTPDRQVPGRARYTPEREKATSRMILYKNNKNGGDSTIGLVSQATLSPLLEAVQSRVASLPAFARCLPLKIGIHQDLIALGHSKNAVRQFLGW